jgi:hypothetical protein
VQHTARYQHKSIAWLYAEVRNPKAHQHCNEMTFMKCSGSSMLLFAAVLLLPPALWFGDEGPGSRLEQVLVPQYANHLCGSAAANQTTSSPVAAHVPAAADHCICITHAALLNTAAGVS